MLENDKQSRKSTRNNHAGNGKSEMLCEMQKGLGTRSQSKFPSTLHFIHNNIRCIRSVLFFLHGWPRGKLLDTLSDGRIIQYIDTCKINSLCLKCLYNLGRESAHGHGWISLHVQHDGIVRHVLPNHFHGLVHLVWHVLFLRGEVVVRIREATALKLILTLTLLLLL